MRKELKIILEENLDIVKFFETTEHNTWTLWLEVIGKLVKKFLNKFVARKKFSHWSYGCLVINLQSWD